MQLVIHKTLTRDVVEAAVHRRMSSLDNPGFCTSCGHEHDGIEPDATDYECEACGEPTVFGADEMLICEMWHRDEVARAALSKATRGQT